MPAMMLPRPCPWRLILLIVPTLQRGNGILTLPRQRVQKTVRPEDAIPDHGQAITCIPRCCADK